MNKVVFLALILLSQAAFGDAQTDAFVRSTPQRQTPRPKIKGKVPKKNLAAAKQKQANVDNKIMNAIQRECDAQNMDPHLIRAVIKAESSYKPDATSNKGAIGLMQIMPDTARELCAKENHCPKTNAGFYDIDLNVHLGVAYLKWLKLKFGDDLRTILAAYYGGGGIGRPDTALYADKVLSLLEKITLRLPEITQDPGAAPGRGRALAAKAFTSDVVAKPDAYAESHPIQSLRTTFGRAAD